MAKNQSLLMYGVGLRRTKQNWLDCLLDESTTSWMRRENLPRCEIPGTLASSLRNSTATDSEAGEKDKTLWITLVVSILNLECDAPILTAVPNDSFFPWATSHNAMRHWAITPEESGCTELNVLPGPMITFEEWSIIVTGNFSLVNEAKCSKWGLVTVRWRVGKTELRFVVL